MVLPAAKTHSPRPTPARDDGFAAQAEHFAIGEFANRPAIAAAWLARRSVPSDAVGPEGCAMPGGARCWAGYAHARGRMLVACGNRPLAVDLEELRAIPRGMAARYAAGPGEFWQGWTLSEAVLKLLRTGLRTDPGRLDLAGGRVRLDGRVLPLACRPVEAPPGYAAALAWWADCGPDD